MRLLDGIGKNPHNVGAARIEGTDFSFLDIEAGDGEAFATEQQREGQTDIPHPNDADLSLPALYLLFEF